MTIDKRHIQLYDIAVTAADLIDDMRLTDFYHNEIAQQLTRQLLAAGFTIDDEQKSVSAKFLEEK